MSHESKQKLPKHYRRLNKSFPEYMEAVRRLGEAAQKEGPLDQKSVQLVQLAAAAATRSEGGGAQPHPAGRLRPGPRRMKSVTP